MSDMSGMRYAAFFRNLNLGRPRCPDRAAFEAAFVAAGALSAASFLTNGTMAFDAPSARAAARVVAGAQKLLLQQVGLREPAFLREMEWLADLVAAQPFDGVEQAGVYGCYVSFLHRDAVVPLDAVLRMARGEVEVVCMSGREVFSVARQIGKSPGSPNAFLEKLLALPATTRAWNTVVRLVEKHG